MITRIVKFGFSQGEQADKGDYGDHTSVQGTLQEAAAALQKGGLVAFPTETVYGLGANAFLPLSVNRVFTVKGRPQDNPLIVHLPDLSMLPNVCRAVPDIFYKLYERLSPGPITYVLPRNTGLPSCVSAGLDSVAVRFPANAAAQAFLREAKVPVVAPSANISGKPSPTTAAHVVRDFAGKIPYIIDGGACEVGVESTVLDLTVAEPVILRPGVITREIIKAETGIDVHGYMQKQLKNGETPKAPGMKYRHYAPEARIFVVDGPDETAKVQNFVSLYKENAMALRGQKIGIFMRAKLWDQAKPYIAAVISALRPESSPDRGGSGPSSDRHYSELSSDFYGSGFVKVYDGANIMQPQVAVFITDDNKLQASDATHKLFATLREFDLKMVKYAFVEGFAFRGSDFEAYENRLKKASATKIRGNMEPALQYRAEHAAPKQVSAQNFGSSKFFDGQSRQEICGKDAGDIKNILFVCTGNTCRSPMAEYLMRAAINIPDINIASRGLAVTGCHAEPGAIKAMAHYGLDMNSHAPKQLMPEDVEQADLILTMTQKQAAMLRRYFPRKTIHSLKIFAKLLTTFDTAEDDVRGATLPERGGTTVDNAYGATTSERGGTTVDNAYGATLPERGGTTVDNAYGASLPEHAGTAEAKSPCDGSSLDIADPYGQSDDVYLSVAAEIKTAVQSIISYLNLGLDK